MTAAADHHRVTPEAQIVGRATARIAQYGFDKMRGSGLHDTRCATCAYRVGTVPNGCAQTQLDVLKALCAGDDFGCHAPRGVHCAGHIAARLALLDHPMPEPLKRMAAGWAYSPPDARP